MFGNCSSQLPHLIEELPQWPSGPSLVTPAAESHRIPKPDQTVFNRFMHFCQSMPIVE